MASNLPYRKVITNAYLNESRVIKGATRREVNTRAKMQLQKWHEAELRKREREMQQAARAFERGLQQAEKERASQAVAAAKIRADELSFAVKQQLDTIEQTVSRVAERNLFGMWKELYDVREYPPFHFREPPTMATAKGLIGDAPAKSIVEAVSTKARVEREQQEAALANYYNMLISQYNDEIGLARAEYDHKRSSFYGARDAENQRLFEVSQATIADTESLLELASLAASLFSRLVFGELSITPSLAVDEVLPVEGVMPGVGPTALFDVELLNPEDMPAIKSYKYVASRQTIDEVAFKKTEKDRLYETYVFSTIAGLLLFMNEPMSRAGIESICVNAWVTSVDAASGNERLLCILSLQAQCSQIAAINFLKADPKECIRSLRGVYSGSLSSLTPVKPKLTYDADEQCFAKASEGIAELDTTQNLAIMDWENFEFLMHGLLGKLFGGSGGEPGGKLGGEIEIIESSRDAGIDAIAIAPIPSEAASMSFR